MAGGGPANRSQDRMTVSRFSSQAGTRARSRVLVHSPQCGTNAPIGLYPHTPCRIGCMFGAFARSMLAAPIAQLCVAVPECGTWAGCKRWAICGLSGQVRIDARAALDGAGTGAALAGRLWLLRRPQEAGRGRPSATPSGAARGV